jgi:hypothetical protein
LQSAVVADMLGSVTSGERQVDSTIPQADGRELSLSVNPLPDRLEAIAREIALDMQANIEDLARGWYDRMAAVSELARWAAPELKEIGLANARVDIGREVAGLVDGRQLPSECPPEISLSARLGASMNYPLWAALQAYRAGHAVQWEAWSDRVAARGLEPPERELLLKAGSDYMFAYADRCARWMEIEFTRARDERMRTDEQRRTQLVRNLLDGQPIDGSQIGYDLDGWHVGLIASGAEAEVTVRKAGSAFGGQLLAVAVDAITWWAWAGFPEPPATAIVSQVRPALLPPDCRLALGEPANGPAGFRQTHREASAAFALTATLAQPIVSYSDIALEDLASADPGRARVFIERELGPLAGDDRRAELLRDTLRAYFAAAQTASSTAQMLGVHERTIGNRIHAVEQLIGRSVHSRRAELETALRLHRLATATDTR